MNGHVYGQFPWMNAGSDPFIKDDTVVDWKDGDTTIQLKSGSKIEALGK